MYELRRALEALPTERDTFSGLDTRYLAFELVILARLNRRLASYKTKKRLLFNENPQFMDDFSHWVHGFGRNAAHS